MLFLRKDEWFHFETLKCADSPGDRRRRVGFVRLGGCGSAIFAVLAEVEQGVAELTVQGDLIAASEFNAGEVETFGREAGVVVGVGGRGGLRERFAGEALPSKSEFKLGLMLGVGLRGVEVADILFLSGQLKFNESGFGGDYTGFTEGDGGELVDEGGFEGIGVAGAIGD